MDLCQITILRTSYQRLRRADDMNIVLDTNILISAAWSPGRNASNILNAVFARKFTACYDYRILEEYHRVLHYPKFKFYEWEINAILEPMIKNGISVRKFYEVAKNCNAILVTGNLAHYPSDSIIMSPSDFCQRYL